MTITAVTVVETLAEPAKYTSAEVIAMSNAWWDLSMQLGYICLAVGFALGMFAGYMYARNKFSKKIPETDGIIG